MKFAPECFYVEGNTALLRKQPRVSVIGSRSASLEGLELAHQISQVITRHGGGVVSGLAKGIDAAAHQGAIKAGGDTIAVLGTPLDKFYPKENRNLQERIGREHLLVTQFPTEKPVGKKNFVMRNRTMALISHASVIVEAGEKSGTEHQGWEALRLGRILFISESLANAAFDWPRKMLNYGAIVYSDEDDFRELLEDFLPSLIPIYQAASHTSSALNL